MAYTIIYEQKRAFSVLEKALLIKDSLLKPKFLQMKNSMIFGIMVKQRLKRILIGGKKNCISRIEKDG